MFRLSKPTVILAIMGTLALARLGNARQPTRDATEMARRIDELIAQRWSELEVRPSPPASDSALLRRLYLDLTGVIPRVSSARAFLDDQTDDKRARLIDALLESPAHVTHMASTWRNILLSGRFGAEQLDDIIGIQTWLRDQFVQNMRYDRIVADFLVATGEGRSGPAVFYTSQDLQPEKLASSTARIFLGLRVQCAQCHDHPFDHWTQRDFWGFAAFFARLPQTNNAPRTNLRLEDLDQGEVMLPNTEEVVFPRYLGGDLADESEGGTRRLQLAIWMASRDNPYLARAAVNRVWAHMMGRGLVEPLDDFGDHNPPCHPELLDELAAYFIRTRFDLRQLFRTLANTRVYQLSSEGHDAPVLPPDSFARMAVKALTPEQLYDCLNRSLMRRPQAERLPNAFAPNRLLDRQRLAFIVKMQSPSETSTEYWGGVPQALTLMNGSEIEEATNLETGGLLTSLEAPLFTDEERVETLFLATLSRRPSDEERIKFVVHVNRASSTSNRRRALGDCLWALLNSGEFALNH